MSVSTGESAPEKAATPSCATGCLLLFFGFFLLSGALTAVTMVATLPGAAKLAALFPLIFAAVGAGGIWGVLRARDTLQSFSLRKSRPPELQTNLPIPKLRTYMGRDLPVRLSMDTSQKGHAGVLLAVTLFWNGIVGIFVAVGLFSKELDSIIWLILTPFILIGIAIFIMLIKQVMLLLRVPDTVVEMTEEPAAPGETVRIMLTQAGNLSFDSLTVEAVCEEKISYRRGTDTYNEDHKVWSEMLHRSGKLDVSGGRPFKHTIELEIPANAMHSFDSSNNKIVWKLVVKGALIRWPDFEFVYPFRVVPPEVRERVSWKRESLSV